MPNKPQAPLWEGPYDDGITFSLLCRFLVCRHRFWIRTVLGLVDEEAFNRSIEYGNLWHTAEEWYGKGKPWDVGLRKYRDRLLDRYPDSEEEIEKWHAICKIQFGIYLDFLKRLPDTNKHKSIVDEHTFRVPYTLPSGRTIYLKGKFDRIFYIPAPKANIIYCQENKSKGFIDEEGILKTVAENLQTMLYQIALRSSFRVGTGIIESYTRSSAGNPSRNTIKTPWSCHFDFGNGVVQLPTVPKIGKGRYKPWKIAGVLYNVVRRPLADNYAIKQKTGRTVKDPKTGRVRKVGAETPAQFYARVGELIKSDPMYYFKRWQVQLTENDLTTFRQRTFDPIMEQLCDWWDWIKVDPTDPWRPRTENDMGENVLRYSPHWQAPWGVYNGMYDGFRGDYFELLTQGDHTSPTKTIQTAESYGLQRATTLFPELT